jgi:isocitrate dehydrogenase
MLVPPLELMAAKNGNPRANLLSKTLDEAIGQYLEDARYPSQKVNEIDNRVGAREGTRRPERKTVLK